MSECQESSQRVILGVPTTLCGHLLSDVWSHILVSIFLLWRSSHLKTLQDIQTQFQVYGQCLETDFRCPDVQTFRQWVL